MNYIKDDKIAQRLSMLYTNYEALINLYYTLYYKHIDEDLEVKQYDNSACIKEATIPNYNKFLNDSVKHGTTNPNTKVSGEISELYINTSSLEVWACTSTGNSSWKRIFSGAGLEDHNYDPNAHANIIAKVSGDSSIKFGIKNISDIVWGDLIEGNKYLALALDYIGNTSLLTTDNNNNLVDAINELQSGYLRQDETTTYMNQGSTNTVYSGNTLGGNATVINLNLTNRQDNASVGVYYVPVSSGDSVEIELVGGGGCLAVTDGGDDVYSDTKRNWRYWHEGGSGGYFKGTFVAPRNGLVQLITPNSGEISGTDGNGEDAIALFISAGQETVELARAKGGKSGFPIPPALFYSEVEGGEVTYDSDLVSNVETSLKGSSGVVYKEEFVGI